MVVILLVAVGFVVGAGALLGGLAQHGTASRPRTPSTPSASGRPVQSGPLLAAPPAQAPLSAPRSGPYWMGTLVSTTDHASAESQSGVRVAMMELSWRQYEPRRGHVDRAYAAQLRSQLDTFLAAGRRVTLGLGLTDPPGWVYDIPDSRLVDQHGERSKELNFIFNQSVREAADEYLVRLAEDLPLQQVWAVRINSGSQVEMIYPGHGSYWAFDANAQNGRDRPPSMPANPLPGWKPGDRSVAVSEVRRWADWYVGALDDVADWQVSQLSGLGFKGWYQILTPGSGVRPDDYNRAVADHLPDGLTGIGAVWSVFYAQLRRNGHIVAYVTSMADRSGGDDVCQPDDRRVAVDDPAADRWSSTRWISRLADEYGLPKNGENPGWNFPATLNAHYQDPSPAGMMQAAFRQMISCGFQGMYWAHDEQLWNGTSSFARYAALVEGTNHGSSVVPPWPS